jgi:thymidine phosphorylase
MNTAGPAQAGRSTSEPGLAAEPLLPASEGLRFKPLAIDTSQEHVVYMHRECPVCRSEGLSAQARVAVSCGKRQIIATLNVVDTPLLQRGELSLSAGAARMLGARSGDLMTVGHAPTLDSLSAVRAKIFGNALDAVQLQAIIADVAAGRYSDVHIAAFLTACAGGRMSAQETVELTRAMVHAGERLRWDRPVVVDKHCVGGLPGNRTTPIVVAIAAAAGLMCPKTSSRAITSPAGTADTMEVLTTVSLSTAQMRRVVEREGACFVWGGAVGLSPADDVLIRVERPLGLDSDAQLVASVLSKKIAAGATHAVIDLPVGPTAKVRSDADAQHLHGLLDTVAGALGLRVLVLRSDGTQPVGRGIGPALEARDVLAVLQGRPDAPADLRERALLLAARLIELGGAAADGSARAEQLLAGGQAWQRFQAICEAQGGLRQVPTAPFRQDVVARMPGRIVAMDCRHIARGAKLAGAPREPAAGIDLKVRVGDLVEPGQPLLTLHAQARGELAYAADYLQRHPPIVIEAS